MWETKNRKWLVATASEAEASRPYVTDWEQVGSQIFYCMKCKDVQGMKVVSRNSAWTFLRSGKNTE